ncbi:MAG TPA: thioredoxin fold domain-containing protein [Opitutaceae bacterium]
MSHFFARLLGVLILLAIPRFAAAAPNTAAWTPIENQVAQITAGPQVTIVHFWAPWCPNCRAELDKFGWRDFLLVNSDVKVVFVTIWSADDGAAVLKKAGLTEQANFQALVHPNTSRKEEDRMQTFMGESISWIPTTWIFKDGQLRYALNYGEMHFSLLQQLVRDASDKWEHTITPK